MEEWMNSKLYPYMLAVITLVFWGIAPIFGKIGFAKISPILVLFYSAYRPIYWEYQKP